MIEIKKLVVGHTNTKLVGSESSPNTREANTIKKLR